ncbi:TonB family protein [Ichthyenterobacterium magnum]|uniref:TonB family protein n=1 Tax=Ichthyenterobacterium magnum TaxID=1230530 RepID=UPI0011C38A34|nr:TonB family protein [Ichthyenterobacterium magnum]
MNFIKQHKALILTILITGIIVFGMFSFHITKQNKLIAESYYEIEPQTVEELKKLEELKALEESLSKTNQAFNEDKAFKDMMKNFKSVNANDFEKTTKALEEKAEQDVEDVVTSSPSYNNSKDYAINNDERSSFKKANDILALRSSEKRKESTNANSTLTYSLKDRDIINYDTPRYLCEESGKIVVNITVNASGEVTNSYINTSSTTNNECLTEHALEYAKAVLFNSASNASQLGSITFYFKGKN